MTLHCRHERWSGTRGEALKKEVAIGDGQNQVFEAKRVFQEEEKEDISNYIYVVGMFPFGILEEWDLKSRWKVDQHSFLTYLASSHCQESGSFVFPGLNDRDPKSNYEEVSDWGAVWVPRRLFIESGILGLKLALSLEIHVYYVHTIIWNHRKNWTKRHKILKSLHLHRG